MGYDKTAKVLVGNAAQREAAYMGEGGWIGSGNVLGRYDTGVPVSEIKRLLMNFDVLEVPSANLVPVDLDNEGGFDLILNGQAYKAVVVEGKKALVRSDDFSELGRHGKNYSVHHYEEWLLNRISNIVSDTLSIDNAVSLRNGSQMAVTVRLSEELHDSSTGAAFWPFLLAYTSLDGSLATTYSASIRLPICDNMWQSITLEAKRAGRQFKRKHTRFSDTAGVERDARQALLVMERTAGKFEKFAATTSSVKVTRKQWLDFVDIIEPPAPADATKAKTTKTENRRELLDDLYTQSPMVAPWTGTAFGVLQAMNTYVQHGQNVRGMHPLERAYDKAIREDIGSSDIRMVEALSQVLERDLLPA